MTDPETIMRVAYGVYTMNPVVKILMERDGMTEREAVDLVKEIKEELLYNDGWCSDDIIMENLGLEPDYIMDILEID